MRDLDDTDAEILTLLAADARRPYSEIGEAVGLSGPAVSDRVSRLVEAGVIDRFTVDVDRSQLGGGVPVFVRASVPGGVDALRGDLSDAEAVEHVFVTADGEVWFHARVEARNVRRWLGDLLPDDAEHDVTLIDEADWQPSLSGTEFALTCVECGNTVDSEGETERLGGDVYQFCCSSCRSRFVERYERMEEGAG